MDGKHHTTPWRGARAQRAAALGLCLSIGLAAAVGPAQAEKVGVAAAVNPDAFSSLSQTPNQQLNIGKSIFFNERINTTNSGLVQVLLVDGSTFTVGPNSNLVIDKFVYDPRKKTGELVATFSKGTMRFIGGKLSKNEGGVTVNTPSGALAIRGGMFQGSTSRGVYSFLFGDSLTFRGRNGQTRTVYETGYSIDLNGGTNVRPTTPEDTNVFMAALSGSGTNFGGGAGAPNNPANQGGVPQQVTNVENGADQEISDANFVMVQTAIQEQLVRLQNLKNNTQPPQNTTPPSGGTPGPIKNGGEFTGFASGFLQTGTDGEGEPELLTNGKARVFLDPKGNTVTANIDTDHVRVSKGHVKLPVPWPFNYVLGRNVKVDTQTTTTTSFGLDFFGDGSGAYIDDNTFLALADDGSTSVVRNISRYGELKLKTIFGRVTFTVSPPDQEVGFQQVAHTDGGFGSVPGPSLCNKCDFLKYGFWGSDVTYDENTDKMGGWWVGTNQPPVDSDDLPLKGTATYEGNAVGMFARKSDGIWVQEKARGDLDMNWDFAWRRGRLDITDFGTDNLGRKSFGGWMESPGGVVDFAGDISGQGGKGFASGTFVGARPGTAPAAVMGNFGVDHKNWKANGIFGGANTNFDPSGSLRK
jgi:FecR protein